MNDRLTVLILIALILAGCVLPVVSYDPPLSPVSPPPVSRSLGLLDVEREPYHVVEVRPDWARVPDAAPMWVECQLRYAEGRGVVGNQGLYLSYTEMVATTWKTDDLEPGWYELFCRAYQGGALLPGVFNAESQDCTEGCGFEFISHWEVR